MVGSFPVVICVKLKYRKLCVMVPVEKSTTVVALKEAFIEAYRSTDPEDEDVEAEMTIKTLKLFKQGVNEEGDESWVALDDKSNVDKAGLDQGHTVGVSFSKNGKFAEPVIANYEEHAEAMPLD